MVDRLMRGEGSDEDVKELSQSLTGIAPIFSELPYFMSEEFTLTDCCLAPILWRIHEMGLKVDKSRQTKPLFDYMERIFSREAYQESMSSLEREMTPPI